MIRHLVLFKLKPGVTRDDPRIARWMEMTADLPGQISTIVGWETGWNVSDRPIACDYALNATFRTREDVVAYGPHPAHRAMVDVAREVADWVICDYEYQNSMQGEQGMGGQ